MFWILYNDEIMKIVLGENNYNNRTFSSKINALLTNEMCGIKFIKEEVEIYIPYEQVLDSGMISNTNIFFEEVLYTLNVRKVYLSQKNNEYLKNVSSYYNIKFYTDFSV